MAGCRALQVDQLSGMENSMTIGFPDCNAAEKVRWTSALASDGPSNEAAKATETAKKGSAKDRRSTASVWNAASDGGPPTCAYFSSE
mmetsp:Transcript_86780/g.280420  ORF Transcript_86780/g.280420 Transcript_86780/m.280420 type:complete len:87 (+) Transcript_86780:400-660(+)